MLSNADRVIANARKLQRRGSNRWVREVVLPYLRRLTPNADILCVYPEFRKPPLEWCIRTAAKDAFPYEEPFSVDGMIRCWDAETAAGLALGLP